LLHNQKTMELFVWEKNLKAVTFYEHCGFYCAGKMEKELGGHKLKGYLMKAVDIKELHHRLTQPPEPGIAIYLD
ncbi:MAG: hypothetical protein PSV35_04045, partial [bacterium]|nr:hypothetical protein [bacterium]